MAQKHIVILKIVIHQIQNKIENKKLKIKNIRTQ